VSSGDRLLLFGVPMVGDDNRVWSLNLNDLRWHMDNYASSRMSASHHGNNQSQWTTHWGWLKSNEHGSKPRLPNYVHCYPLPSNSNSNTSTSPHSAGNRSPTTRSPRGSIDGNDSSTSGGSGSGSGDSRLICFGDRHDFRSKAVDYWHINTQVLKQKKGITSRRSSTNSPRHGGHHPPSSSIDSPSSTLITGAPPSTTPLQTMIQPRFQSQYIRLTAPERQHEILGRRTNQFCAHLTLGLFSGRVMFAAFCISWK
jgi:hypothetical protein